MRRATTLAGAIMTWLLLANASVACAQNSAAWDATSPSGGRGTITGSGTYITAPGWTVVSGSVSYRVVGAMLWSNLGIPAPAGGTWGFLLNNLAAGNYEIYVTITFTNGTINQTAKTNNVFVTVRP